MVGDNKRPADEDDAVHKCPRTGNRLPCVRASAGAASETTDVRRALPLTDASSDRHTNDTEQHHVEHPTAGDTLKILVLGDSITKGLVLDRNTFRAVNLAFNGDNFALAQQKLTEKRVANGLMASKVSKADAVVVSLGFNEVDRAPQVFKSYLDKLLKVCGVGIPYLVLEPTYDTTYKRKPMIENGEAAIAVWKEAEKGCAAARNGEQCGWPPIDLHIVPCPRLGCAKEHYSDGVHPNAVGYAKLRCDVEEYLHKCLGASGLMQNSP